MLSSSKMARRFEFDFCYFAFLDRLRFPGVAKKIEQTTKALRDRGFNAQAYLVDPKPSLSAIADIATRIVVGRAKTIIVRSSARTLFLIPAFVIAKLQSKKIILEVPTPIRVSNREIWSSDLNPFKRIIIICAQLAAFPLCFFFVDRVLEYAEESAWFSWGNRHKICLVTNGIAVDTIKARNQIPAWPSHSFKLIGVAAIAYWHGFDRIIKGMADFKIQRHQGMVRPQVEFYIVGPSEGADVKKLQAMAKELGLDEQVHFLGALEGDDLSLAFERAHVAVGSIGAHRKALLRGSTLKAREYSARGIPFLCSLEDQDFKPRPNFVLKVPADDSPIHIEDIIEFYENFAVSNQEFLNIRRYAEANLDFKNKIGVFQI